jgi:RES domain-containing protein
VRLWRIVTGTHPAWSGEGARQFGQRWTPPGLPAIYTGTSFAVCLLAVLVHANRRAPPSAARVVEATVPDEVSREAFDPAAHPGWDDPHDTRIAASRRPSAPPGCGSGAAPSCSCPPWSPVGGTALSW